LAAIAWGHRVGICRHGVVTHGIVAVGAGERAVRCVVGGFGLWWRGFWVVGWVWGVELRWGRGGCIVF
jgi:hypothetical protein